MRLRRGKKCEVRFRQLSLTRNPTGFETGMWFSRKYSELISENERLIFNLVKSDEAYIHLSPILFIYSLFNDVVSSSGKKH
jgi:hypothetical protein